MFPSQSQPKPSYQNQCHPRCQGVTENDVILAKGNRRWPGNAKIRAHIGSLAQSYLSADKSTRQRIVTDAVNSVRPNRFLNREGLEVTREVAAEKVAQLFERSAAKLIDQHSQQTNSDKRTSLQHTEKGNNNLERTAFHFLNNQPNTVNNFFFVGNTFTNGSSQRASTDPCDDSKPPAQLLVEPGNVNPAIDQQLAAMGLTLADIEPRPIDERKAPSQHATNSGNRHQAHTLDEDPLDELLHSFMDNSELLHTVMDSMEQVQNTVTVDRKRQNKDQNDHLSKPSKRQRRSEDRSNSQKAHTSLPKISKSPRQVQTKSDRESIITCRNQLLKNNVGFTQLSFAHQVRLIAEKTGFGKIGVQNVLGGKPHREVRSQAARDVIINRRNQLVASDIGFTELSTEAQTVRIAKDTWYRPSHVKAVLEGKGIRQVRYQSDRISINTHRDTIIQKEPDFIHLPLSEQVERIAVITGYNQTGVQNVLEGKGTSRVRHQPDFDAITNRFKQLMATDYAFVNLSLTEKANRIATETGYIQASIQTVLENLSSGNSTSTSTSNQSGIHMGQSQMSVKDPVLTQFPVTDQIDQATTGRGYKQIGAQTVPEAGVTGQPRTQAGRKSFTPRQDHLMARGAKLADIPQTKQAKKINTSAGHGQTAVRNPLEGKPDREARTSKARNAVINHYNHLIEHSTDFRQLPLDEQAKRVAVDTGFLQNNVLAILQGKGTQQVRYKSDREAIIAYLNQRLANDSVFAQLPLDEKVKQTSANTGYNQSGVQAILEGKGTLQVRFQTDRRTIKAHHDKLMSSEAGFALLPVEEQAKRISTDTGYRETGILAVLKNKFNTESIIKHYNQSIANDYRFSQLSLAEQFKRVAIDTGIDQSEVQDILEGWRAVNQL